MSTVHTKSHDGILLHMKWLSSYLLIEVARQMKAACICTLTLLVKSKQFFLFLWALFTDSSTFIKQKQVGFRFNTICFFIESFTVSCNENKIFAKTCKDLQVTGLWHIVTQIQCIPCTPCTEYAYVFIGKGPESKIGFFVLQQYLAPLNNNQTTLKGGTRGEF